MANKVYAVRKGRKTGLFYTWDDCKAQVQGYSQAQYKSFTSEAEAQEYLDAGNTKKPSKDLDPKNVAIAYVDGSYNNDTGIYGCGAIIEYKDQVERLSKSNSLKEFKSMRNVAGELLGTVMAIKAAIKMGAPEIVIHYDYQGIEEWAEGGWAANKEGTIAYKNFINEVREKNLIRISFVKVKAHSGVELNEKVDILAKISVGLIEVNENPNTTIFNGITDKFDLKEFMPRNKVSYVELTESEQEFVEREPNVINTICAYIYKYIKEDPMDIQDMLLENKISDCKEFETLFDKLYRKIMERKGE